MPNIARGLGEKKKIIIQRENKGKGEDFGSFSRFPGGRKKLPRGPTLRPCVDERKKTTGKEGKGHAYYGVKNRAIPERLRRPASSWAGGGGILRKRKNADGISKGDTVSPWEEGNINLTGGKAPNREKFAKKGKTGGRSLHQKRSRGKGLTSP